MASSKEFKPIGGYQYMPIEGVEKMEYYRPGGYHKINIGDKLHTRYRVLDKFGHGAYSTIWLARDEDFGNLVAVKVGMAFSNPREVDILYALTTAESIGSSGRDMIPSITDSFRIFGPNGTHPCYVIPPAQGSLAQALVASSCGLFQLDVARALVVQLTLAVGYVHGQGLVHGDIHTGNVLLQLAPGVHQLSNEQIYEKFGLPMPLPVERIDGKKLPPGVPTHGLLPALLGEPSDKVTLSEARLLLADFGESFAPSQEARFESHAHRRIRAPEAVFEENITPLSFPSDIWSLACAIWDILCKRPLFETTHSTEDEICCAQVDAFGILPPDWWGQWVAKKRWFTENGTPLAERKGEAKLGSLEALFESSTQKIRRKRGMALFKEDERDALLALLRSMLSYRPENRITAAMVLESEWIKKWAMPAYEQVRSLSDVTPTEHKS